MKNQKENDISVNGHDNISTNNKDLADPMAIPNPHHHNSHSSARSDTPQAKEVEDENKNLQLWSDYDKETL